MPLINSNPFTKVSCSASGSATQVVFDQGSVLIVQGAKTLFSMSLSSVYANITEYGYQEFVLPADASYEITAGMVRGASGTVQGMVFVVEYPSTDNSSETILEADKGITWSYQGVTMPMARVMVLTAPTSNGWFMDGSPATMTISNPNSGYDVKVKLLYFS